MDENPPLGNLDRRQLLKRIGLAGGGTLLVRATAGLGMVTPVENQFPEMPARAGAGKHVLILGAGVGGLAAAYELKRSGYSYTVLEAHPKIGGRSLTLRPGDVLREDPLQPYIDDGATSSTQTCRFEPAPARGYDRPYLNAGPGRIPSAHLHVLRYCKELGVPLEVYIMESRSNIVRGPEGKTYVNRHIASDAQGWMAQLLWQLAPQVPGLDARQRRLLRELVIRFGALEQTEADGWRYMGSTRSGYVQLPDVHEGEPVAPIPLDEILDTGFWETSFYQPLDFLWQATLFQPVGGMDRIAETLADAIGRDNIRTGAPVERLWRENGKWRARVGGGGEVRPADACISNIPLPLLEQPLGDLEELSFRPRFREALQAIFDIQTTGIQGFLAPTCKVGWQARRDLWQSHDPADNRVVPIFGGISWTKAAMTQLWYPSDRFFDDLGVLTGAYNFSDNATRWGRHSPAWRLREAKREAGELAGKNFAAGLNDDPRDGLGLSIAWQNIKHVRGGWAQWQNVPRQLENYNALLAGDRKSGFYVCGDQMSALPGWQEGAIASAIHAARMIAVETYEAPAARSVPDSRIMVEGMIPMEIDE